MVRFKKYILTFLSVLMMVTSLYTVRAVEGSAYINDDGINFRTGPSTSYSTVKFTYQNLSSENPTNVGIQFSKGQYVDIIGEENGWYKVRAYYNGYPFEGYIKGDFVTPFGYDLDFDAYLTEQGFPETYKPYLQALHACFPQWTFKAYHTGLNWENVIEIESTLGTNLIDGSNETYRSVEEGSFDLEKRQWIQLQKGWYGVNRQTVAFFMDPRNYLVDGTAFAFESLSNQAEVDFESLKRVFKGYHWGQGETPEEQDASMDRIIQEFIDAGIEHNVSPYFLASRAKQELGTSNTNASITGGEFVVKEATKETLENGTEIEIEAVVESGYYNFYNIGAYNTNIDGLIYAMGGINKTNTSYGRPWDTTAKAIAGGAQFLANAYIAQGQDTLYLQKFNVTPKNTYSHQYMQNVRAPFSEGWSTYKMYRDNGLLEENYVFSIPVYDNMPEITTLPLSVDVPLPTVYDYVSSLDWKLTDVYVTGIDPKTPAQDITSKITTINPLATVTWLDQDGVEYSEGSIGTGDTIKIVDDTGEMTYIIVIYGDINGDGSIGATDLLKVKNHIIEKEALTGAYRQAALLANDTIAATSLLKIKKDILGTEKINQKR